uniref:Uncharacterized protein n=1 Tax=Rhizophora mucronata TaxID=61149 RepID=A0A2P2JI91_RHIMU
MLAVNPTPKLLLWWFSRMKQLLL